MDGMKQKPPLIDATITIAGQKHHLSVSMPYGGGDQYHVLVDDYFKGQIVPSPDGWIEYIKRDILTDEAVAKIMERVKADNPKQPQI